MNSEPLSPFPLLALAATKFGFITPAKCMRNASTTSAERSLKHTTTYWLARYTSSTGTCSICIKHSRYIRRELHVSRLCQTDRRLDCDHLTRRQVLMT